MHATPTPKTTRVTRTAYGKNGARPGHLWCLMSLHCTRPCAVCVTSPPALTVPLSAHCIGLRGTPPVNVTGGSDALNPSPPVLTPTP
eukprot:4499832-Pleurochrysis_carterae.AAC.1